MRPIQCILKNGHAHGAPARICFPTPWNKNFGLYETAVYRGHSHCPLFVGDLGRQEIDQVGFGNAIRFVLLAFGAILVNSRARMLTFQGVPSQPAY